MKVRKTDSEVKAKISKSLKSFWRKKKTGTVAKKVVAKKASTVTRKPASRVKPVITGFDAR